MYAKVKYYPIAAQNDGILDFDPMSDANVRIQLGDLSLFVQPQ